MSQVAQYLIFIVENRRLALPVLDVERVLRAVAVTPINGNKPGIRGIIDYHGVHLPLMDARGVLDLEQKKLSPDLHILICCAGDQKFSLLIDDVIGVEAIPRARIAPMEHLLPGANLGERCAVFKSDGHDVLVYPTAFFFQSPAWSGMGRKSIVSNPE